MKKIDNTPKAVLFVSNVPSPYNVDYLNELGKLRKVTAVFERGFSTERDKSWKELHIQNFDCRILKGIHTAVDAAFSPGVLRYIHKYRKAHIIIGNPATPTGILAILYCKLFRIPFILQSEGGVPKDGKGLKERIKRFLMHDAKLYLSGMSLKNEYFLHYGADPSRVKQYPFTSLYQKDLVSEAPSPEQKQALRRELGIDSARMVLFVGRFVPCKAVDIFMKAGAGLGSDTALVLVGGEPGPEHAALEKQLGLTNVYYVNHVGKETVKKYYRAADVFVLPTRGDTWGLVINEAMASGLPVITTTACVAGVELIEENVNGYLIDVDDWQSLHERIIKILSDTTLCKGMSEESLKKIQPYTLENMAAVIHQALEESDRNEIR